MLQAVATVALTLMLVAEAEEPAKRDVYRFVPITRKPTKRSKYQERMARSDGYTARPTPPYAKMFGVRGDGTKRPTTQRYTEAKGDGFMKYFRKYFTTKRPTMRRYNAAGDVYRRPTQRPRYQAASDAYRRPTQRPRYNVASDGYRRPTQRPTPRRYGVQQVGADRKTGRPTKPYLRVARDEEKMDKKKQVDMKEVVPDPELLDKKYFLLKPRLSWDEAQEACARRGAQLATIHSAEEKLRVSRACSADCWIGAKRKDLSSKFTWSDFSSVSFGKVWEGKNEKNEKGLCVKVSGDTWTSAECGKKAASVCEKMRWEPRVEAEMDDGYLSSVSQFASGNFMLVAFVGAIAVLVIVAVISNYVCVFAKNEGKYVKVEASDETTPLLWTRD